MNIAIFLIAAVSFSVIITLGTHVAHVKNNGFLGAILETLAFIIALVSIVYLYEANEIILAIGAILFYIDSKSKGAVNESIAVFNKHLKKKGL